VMVGAVAREVSDRRADLVALLRRHALREIDRVGDAEAEQPAVEIPAALGVGDVDAEVPEAPDAERTRQLHSADEEMFGSRLSNAFGLVHVSVPLRFLALGSELYARRSCRDFLTEPVRFAPALKCRPILGIDRDTGATASSQHDPSPWGGERVSD